MNKIEKLICLVLGGVLAWWIFVETPKRDKAAKATRQAQTVAAARADAERVAKASGEQAAKPADEVSTAAGVPQVAPPKTPNVPEKVVALENGELKLELSSWGAVIRRATLKDYAQGKGEISEANPAVALSFGDLGLGAIGGLACVGENSPYELRGQTTNSVTFANDAVSRTITLGTGYRVRIEDVFTRGFDEDAVTSMSLGSMSMGNSKNDLLSIDSMVMDNGKGKSAVMHHCEGDSPLKSYLVGGISGGCSGSSSAVGLPRVTPPIPVNGAQRWIALKNRFFVVALASCSQDNLGFAAEVARDMRSSNYRPETVSAQARFAGVPERRVSEFYIGPKKQSCLWDLGMRDVMDFGMWRWLCYPLVWVLNLFNAWIPNYGVAIILLTILVRIIFWPLTRKSTEGMKRMTEIQPLMKEIQAKYKDNPQRMQQETWQLYKDKKVNPMSSCLPMLIQIPIFIALFNVLRSAVELRYAPFLWIGDLSEPEALFASWFPFGGLNILPILMALTTGLQSAFTPSTGDRKQQQMMMIMMPCMMLFMFYSFPSALSLYWFLSNLFSIVQMWLIRRQTATR